MNIREEDAQLTDSERLVYAAAFAVDSVVHMPCSRMSAAASAWVAVMQLREDSEVLKQSIDWDRVEEMFRSFRSPRVR